MNIATNQFAVKTLPSFEVTNEPYASAIARFAKGLRESLNKHDKGNKIPPHAMMFVCESEKLMAEIATELVKINSRIKLSLNPSESDIDDPSIVAEHVEKFKKEHLGNVCKTTLHDKETYDSAIILVTNSIYGCNFSHLNQNPSTLVFICTLPLLEQKDLFLGCTSDVADRLLPAFFGGKSCMVTYIKTGQYPELNIKSQMNDQRNEYIKYLNSIINI